MIWLPRDFWPDPNKAAIIAPNHTSYLDAPTLALITPKPILFAADPYYATREPWRSILLTIGKVKKCEMVPMEVGTVRGVRPLARRLQEGGWVCIFPEGGISTGADYPGVRWLSEKTGAVIHRLRIDTIGRGKLRVPVSITPALAR